MLVSSHAPPLWANALKVNEQRQGIVDILCDNKDKIIAACRPLLQQFYHRLIPHDVCARNCIRMSRVHGMFLFVSIESESENVNETINPFSKTTPCSKTTELV